MLYSFKFYGYIIEVGKGKCYEMNADHQGLTFKRQKWDDGSAEFEQHLAHPPEGYDFSMALSYMYGNLWPQEDPNEEKFWSQGIFEAKKYNTIVWQQGLHLLHFFDSFENIYMTTHTLKIISKPSTNTLNRQIAYFTRRSILLTG